jgi:hypothetical protein
MEVLNKTKAKILEEYRKFFKKFNKENMKNATNESTQSYERGRSENLLITCANLVDRYMTAKHSKSSKRYVITKIWYKKRDASWNATTIIYKDNKVTENGYVCENGKGWDIVEACENYRENLLRYFDEELKPSSSFTNLYEIEQILDRKEGIRRNNLGAIVNSPLEEIEQQLAELVNKINNLKNV